MCTLNWNVSPVSSLRTINWLYNLFIINGWNKINFTEGINVTKLTVNILADNNISSHVSYSYTVLVYCFPVLLDNNHHRL